MARKGPKSKGRKPTQKTTLVTDFQQDQLLDISKSASPGMSETIEKLDRPAKRQKTHDASSIKAIGPQPTGHSDDIINGTQTEDVAGNSFENIVPDEIKHLEDKYEFSTISILSSSKVESRVRNLLQRVGKFTFTETKSKPGVAILNSKAPVASKLISIIEIAKTDIQQQGGKWWQYSKLQSKLSELAVNKQASSKGGKTLTDWEKEQQPPIGASGAQEGTADHEEVSQAALSRNEEDDGAFEAMDTAPPVGFNGISLPVREGGKVRAVPFMTIYFARVPVPGLKELYG